MKFEYDAKARAAYLSFYPIKKRIVKTIEAEGAAIYIDLDSKGKPVGVEICNIGCLGGSDICKGGPYS